MKIYIYVTLLLCISSSALAENLCIEVESKGEGHWPLPESAFVLENALKAKEHLNKTLSKVKNNATPLTLQNSIGLYSEVKNDLIMIEGYILRAQALDASDKDISNGTVRKWCDFLASEAVVWH